MSNNEILRRLRYIFDYSDTQMIAVFGHANCTVSRSEVCNLLKPDENAEQQLCSDLHLASFLDGLIIERRGAKEGAVPEPEKSLTRNIIFRKLKIALDLQSESVLEILKLVGFDLSKHELSAFFRKPGHKHYRECKEQVLRYFLQGLQMKLRGSAE